MRRQLKLQGHGLFVIGAILAASWAAQAFAGENPIKIALIADKTGPLEAYAKQTSAGFAMGLDYATGGSLMVEGHKLAVIEKDSQTKPDIGRNLLNEAYNDDGADIAVGGTNSAVALAMLPVAQDNKKIFIVEPAVADFITGSHWNRYIFRTGRNSTQDAVSNALAIGKPGTVVATLAQDYAFGRDFVTAFKTALAPTGAKLVFEEYAPPLTTDFTAPILKALADEVCYCWSFPACALSPHHFFIAAFTGSLTFGIAAICTLTKWPPTFSTLFI